jgi:hypothetical protein
LDQKACDNTQRFNAERAETAENSRCSSVISVIPVVKFGGHRVVTQPRNEPAAD